MARQKKRKDDGLPSFSLGDVLTSYKTKVTAYSEAEVKSKNAKGIIWAVLFIAASGAVKAFPFSPIFDSWLPSLVGCPAGIILSLLALSYSYRHPSDEGFFSIKDSKSFKQRLFILLIVIVILSSVLVASAPLLTPWGYGVGGTIMIMMVILSVAFGARTPEELSLAIQGLPDPRDLKDDEDQYETSDNEEGTNEIYYNDQGNLGGKL